MISKSALAGRLNALLTGAYGVLAAPLTYSVEQARTINPKLRALYKRIASEDEDHLFTLHGIINTLNGASSKELASIGYDEHVMDDVWRGARHASAHRTPSPAMPESEYARLSKAHDTERRAADMYRQMMIHAPSGIRERLDALRKGELRHASAFARAMDSVKPARETLINTQTRPIQLYCTTQRTAQEALHNPLTATNTRKTAYGTDLHDHKQFGRFTDAWSNTGYI